jgi:hypothetical protein
MESEPEQHHLSDPKPNPERHDFDATPKFNNILGNAEAVSINCKQKNLLSLQQTIIDFRGQCKLSAAILPPN